MLRYTSDDIIHKLRDEMLQRELFATLREAEVLAERWRQHDNRVRPQSALGYRPPAPDTLVPLPSTDRRTPLPAA